MISDFKAVIILILREVVFFFLKKKLIIYRNPWNLSREIELNGNSRAEKIAKIKIPQIGLSSK